MQEEAKARDDILAHELRTPLTPIIVSSTILQDLLRSHEEDDIEQKLERNICRGSEALAHRLEELLDLARYSRGTFKLKLQTTNLKQLIEDSVYRFQPSLYHNRQSSVLEMPDQLPLTQVDPSRLEQVLINLLSNANKFNPPESRIATRASLEANE